MDGFYEPIDKESRERKCPTTGAKGMDEESDMDNK